MNDRRYGDLMRKHQSCLGLNAAFIVSFSFLAPVMTHPLSA